jgi:hypothetical protein
MTEPVFLLGLAIVGTTVVARVLEDAQTGIASQAAQLAELQERLDFAERLLVQQREWPELRPGGEG